MNFEILAPNIDLESWSMEKKRASKQVRVIRIEARAPWVRLVDHWDQRSSGPIQGSYDLEVGVLRSGRMRRFQGQHQFDVGPGEIWLNGMWESCHWEVLEAPCHELVFFLSPEVLVGQHFPEMPHLQWLAPFTAPAPLRPRISPAARARVQTLAELGAALHREIQEMAPDAASPLAFLDTQAKAAFYRVVSNAPEAACLRFRLLVTELLLLLLQNWREPELHGHGTPFTQINPAIIHVLQSQRLVTTQEAARLCGLNRNLFARRFEEIMGLSFTQFDLRHRLNGAQSDLLRSREPLKSIALRWGFADGPHFHRCWVQHLGCTPAEFRRQRPGLWPPRREACGLISPTA